MVVGTDAFRTEAGITAIDKFLTPEILNHLLLEGLQRFLLVGVPREK
jgi:hypothetical protein